MVDRAPGPDATMPLIDWRSGAGQAILASGPRIVTAGVAVTRVRRGRN